MIELGSHFRSDDRSRHSEWLRQKQWFIKAKQNHRRKDEMADKADDQFLGIAAAEIVATEIQIRQFKTKLDVYDQATVDALIENQRLLDEVRSRLDIMLEGAHVMEDGRRVFKSEDGSFVIDEFGKLVGADVIDPDSILGGRTTAEEYLDDFNLEKDLLADRDAIHEFDDLVDDARAEADSGELTVDRMEELSEKLNAKMPSSVRAKMPGFENASNAPDARAIFKSNANAGQDAIPTGQSPDSSFQPDHP